MLVWREKFPISPCQTTGSGCKVMGRMDFSKEIKRETLSSPFEEWILAIKPEINVNRSTADRNIPTGRYRNWENSRGQIASTRPNEQMPKVDSIILDNGTSQIRKPVRSFAQQFNQSPVRDKLRKQNLQNKKKISTAWHNTYQKTKLYNQGRFQFGAR